MPLDSVKSQASVQLAAGAPFLSDANIETALEKAGVSGAAADALVDVNAQARVDGLRAALFVLALIAFLGLFSARRIPTRPTDLGGGTGRTGGERSLGLSLGGGRRRQAVEDTPWCRTNRVRG